MQQPPELKVGKIERELRLPLARVRILSYWRDTPLDILGCPTEYRVDLSLTPRRANGGICFTGKWGRHQFLPLGNLFMLPPGQPVRAKGVSGGHPSIVCEFEANTVDAWFEGDMSWAAGGLGAILDIVSPGIRTSLRRLNEEMRNPGFASQAICELLAAQTVIDLARYCKMKGDARAAGGLASWRLRLIDDRLAEVGAPPTLHELASLCNLSIRQLARGFRSSRGCSIGEHIAQNRLDHAKRLLTTHASVKEISHLLGFTSGANFSTAFRRETGESPREFRDRASITRRT